MRKKLNKNVEVWRGTKTPPTTYHVWVKPDGSIHVHDGTNWKSTDEYITKEEFTTIENNFLNYVNTEITKITNQIPEINYYSLNAVSGEELKSLGSNIKDAYKLVNNKGILCGDYIKLYKDSSLKKVEFDNQILRFTYILAEGNEQIVDVDVSAFLHESEYGVGLQVVDHIISIKKDNDTESFLSISDKGIKLAGVQDAIDAAVANLDEYQKISQADAKYATITTVSNIDNRLEIIEDNALTKEELDNGLSEKVDIIEGKLLSTEDFTSALKAKLESLNNYDDTEINEKVDGIQSLINTLINKDASAAINTFNEIITFLEGVENTENLNNIITSIEQLIAAINTALDNYLTKTDASSTYATKTELSEKVSISNATQSTNGLMSASDKTKLDGIASGATAVTTDTVSSWGYTKNTGTVTSVATGKGLTGGTITNTGTIKCNLNSETSLGTIGTTSKLYAVGVDANNKLCVSVPWTDTNTDTDTHWTTGINAGASGAVANSAQTNPYVTVKDNSTYRSQIRLVGGGSTTVKSDASGNITISSTDTNTWRPLGTTADTACAGNDSRLSNPRPASDVYSWAKASSKPSYSWSEITNKPTFATVATSGSYNDLSNKPTIPSNTNQLTNGAGFITGITKAMVTTALGYTPPTSDTNTTYSAGTGLSLSGTSFSVNYGTTAGTACQGNDSRLSNARPASDVYSWAKASTKPSYSWSEIGSKPTIPTNTNQLTNGAGFITGITNSMVTTALGYTTASTVASLNVDYRTIYVTLNANASLSASAVGATYNGRSITAYVYTSAARTITIPTSGNYVSMCGSSYTTTAGKWVEFNLVCVNGIWHIAKLEQE